MNFDVIKPIRSERGFDVTSDVLSLNMRLIGRDGNMVLNDQAKREGEVQREKSDRKEREDCVRDRDGENSGAIRGPKNPRQHAKSAALDCFHEIIRITQSG